MNLRRLIPVIGFSLLLFSTLLFLRAGPISAQEPPLPPKGSDFSPLTPTLVAPPSPGIDPTLLVKIDPVLLKRLLTTGQTSPFIVYLKTQVDVAAAAATAPLSPQGQPDEVLQRQAIVATLQQTARNTQGGVLQLLNSSAAPGSISGQSTPTSQIKPLWIVNAVAASGSLETVLALAAQPEVEVIRLDKEVRLTLPTETEQAKIMSPALRPCFSESSPFCRPHLWQAEVAIPHRQTPEWGISKIRANVVHNALGITGVGVVVANIDTGVDWQHPVLQSQYRGFTGLGHLPQHLGNWYDTTGDGATYPVDGSGHGTHTMGTMVGGEGKGVAPGAKWIAVKAFNSAGLAQNSWLHEAFQWILSPNGDPTLAPDVVNNSWGTNDGASIEFEPDIKALIAAGIYPVFSAGNNGPNSGTVSSPGSLPNILAVGATTIEEEITTFSGRGPSPFGVIKPNVSAPGKDVISTFPGGSYKSLDGTSMAAPHVAGVVALLLQADPTLAENGLADITNAITTTAVPLGSPFPNNNFGWGRVDAYNAVLSVASSGLLVGTVTQPNGTPVAQAIVQITSKGGGPILTTSTGAAGTYLQGIAAGNYDVTVLAFGFEPTTVFNIAVTTNATTTQDFVLTPSPRGTLQGTIRDKSTNTPLAATITVNGTPASTTSNPANGQYSLSLPVGTYNLTVVAPEHRLGQAFNLTINDGATINQDFSLDPAPSILLIDSGKWYQESKIGYFQQALTDNLYPYDLLQISGPFNHPSDVPITSTLTSYDIVIWSAPQDSPGYVGAGAALKGYLDQGGKLLLSGQDVAFFDGGGDIFTYAPYLYSHLKTRYVADNADSKVLTGTVGGPFAGLAISLTGGDGAANQTSPDVIANADPDFASLLATYERNQGAGLHIGLCVPYRALLLPFGLEGVSNQVDRATLMVRSLDWLLASPAPYGVKLTPTAGTGVGRFNSTVKHTVRVRNTGTQDDSVNLALQSDWPIKVAPPMNLSLTTCQSQVITIGMQVNTTDWHIADTLTVTAHSTSNPALTDIATRTTKSPAPVLLVDDDRFISFAPQFQQMLAANNIPYDYWRVPKDWDGEFPPSPSEDRLQMYPVTVWYTGYDWFQPLVAEEENRLAAYLEHGGRLFFSSQDYLYNLPGTRPGSFAQYYLGTLKHTEDYSSTAITGQTDNLISNHFGPVKLIFPPVYQNNTDALTPTTAAQIMSIGQAKQINGLMNQGVGINQRRWRTAFTAFGPELLPIPDQARFMQRAVGWLSWLGTSRVTPQPHFAQNGETITYTAVLTNDGWAVVKQAYFTATIPTELTVDTYSPDLTLVGNELLWQGPLAQNERKELSYTATLSDPLPIGTLVDQTSWIYYDDHDILFERSADVYVNFPDLAGSTLGVTPALGIKPGEVLTYTLVLKNSGLGADPAVTATTTLPHMLGLAGVDPPAKGSLIIADRSITWTTDVAINEVATLTYRTVISYRPTTPIDAVIRIEDNITSPFELNARTLFEGSRLYMPLIGKN